MSKIILIVDDEEDVLTVLSIRLQKAGYDIFTAKTGPAGLDLAKKICPDLILLDLLLPDMRGEEVCKRIKADSKLKTIPIIFITASQTNDVMQKLKNSGAQEYIIKPFEPNELIAVVKKYVK
jgi:two-component system alkaline phosphatase synthesis response regulator PhoP